DSGRTPRRDRSGRRALRVGADRGRRRAHRSRRSARPHCAPVRSRGGGTRRQARGDGRPDGGGCASPGRGHRAPLSRPRAAQAGPRLRGLLPLLFPAGSGGARSRALTRAARRCDRLHLHPFPDLGGDPHRRRSARALAAAAWTNRRHARGDRPRPGDPRAHARVTAALVRALRAPCKATYVVLHANHARELTAAARAACARLVDAGIPMLSQTVLLRGINDEAAALGELMRALVECRIKPYYLHHGDLAPGTAQWRTGIEEGQALMRALHGRLSGLCQPTYVLDIPGGHGKSPIGPSYLARVSGANGAARYEVKDFNGRRHAYPPAPLETSDRASSL